MPQPLAPSKVQVPQFALLTTIYRYGLKQCTNTLASPLCSLLLIAGAFETNAAIVEWDRNVEPDVAGYRVYQGAASRSYAFVVDAGASTSLNLTNLTPGTTYFLAVTAYTANGLESDYSEEVSYTPPLTPPIIVNTPPVAKSDVYSTPRKTVLTIDTARGVLANDHDEDGEALSALLVNVPARGKVIFNSNGSFKYTPNGASTGPDTFSYRATDGKATSALCVVTITVGPLASPLAYAVISKTPSVEQIASAGASLAGGESENLDGRALQVRLRKNGRMVTHVARFIGASFTTETRDGIPVANGRYVFTRVSGTKGLLVLSETSGAVDGYTVTMGVRQWRGKQVPD